MLQNTSYQLKRYEKSEEKMLQREYENNKVKKPDFFIQNNNQFYFCKLFVSIGNVLELCKVVVSCVLLDFS